MVDQSRPKDPGGGAPIVLCCAHGEGERLEGLVATLRGRGHVVELLEGAELEPRVLASVIERYRGAGLYVLCRGGAFDRDKIDAVREVLLAHRVPFGRTLTLPASDADDLLERVDQSLRRMVAHAPVALQHGPAAPRVDLEHEVARRKRATIMVTPPQAEPPRATLPKPAAKPPAPPPSRGPRATMIGSTPPTIEARAPEPSPPASPTAETTADAIPENVAPQLDTATGAIEIDADLVVDETSIHPARSSRTPAIEEEIESSVDLDGVLAGIGDRTTVAPAPSRTGTQVADAIPFEGYGDDGIDISDVTQVARAPDLVPSGPMQTVPSPILARPPVVPTVVEEEGPSRLRFGIAAVVGSLAIGILAAVIVTSNDDDAPPSASPTTIAQKPIDTKATDTKATDAKVEDTKAEDTKVEDTKVEDTKAEDTKVEDTKVEDTKVEDTKVEDTKATPPVTPTKVAIAETKPPAARPRPPRRVEVIAPPKTRVLKALRERTIRALDVLLVTRRATAPMTQQAAVAHCDGLDIAGLAQWRLPEVGELASLTDAGLVGGGFYWSATPADTFGDSRMAWNGGRRQANLRWKGSAVICVRGQRGA